jgi:hypothetical protein
VGRLTPRRLAAAFGGAVVAALTAVWVLGDRPPPWYPPCLWHALTGYYCAGCGSSRAVHALVHGEVWRAAHENGLLVLLTPFALGWAADSLWRGLRHNLPPRRAPRGVAAVLLVVILVFFVVRNFPWWPFTLLAPV